MTSTTKVRLVRCPKCRLVLLELADVPVYKCGECGTFLQAKNRKNDAKTIKSNLHEADAAQMNELVHVSEDKDSSSSGDNAILSSIGECSLEENNGRDRKSRSEDCNSERMGGINLSSENHNNGIDQNEFGNCNMEQPGVPKEICSSMELAYHKNEELSAFAGANSEMEINCECSQLAGEKPELELNEEIDSHIRSSSTDNLVATGGNSSTDNAHRPVDGSVSSDPSSTELAYHENGELSPFAGADSEAEVNGESSPLAGEKPEADLNEESDSHIRSLSTDNLVATRGISSTVNGHRPKDESVSSDPLISSPSEQQEQPQNTVLHGFDRAKSTDTFESTDFVNPSSELSGLLRDMYKSPTTRSSHAYYGSVSSYDGADDQFPDRYIRPFKSTTKVANFVATERRHARGKFLANSNSETQHQVRNSSSILSDNKHYAMKCSKWDRDALLESPRRVLPVRNLIRVEGDEFPSRVPFYQRGSQAGYESGSPSKQGFDEFQSNSSFRSSHEYPELDKMKLLRMVYELQDQMNRTCYLKGKANGRGSTRVTWNEKHIPIYYNPEAPQSEIHQDLNYSRYPGRCKQGRKFSRVPYSGEATSTKHRVDHSCFHCSQDLCSVQQPPPILHRNKGLCWVHSGCNPYISCPSSPQRYLNSELPKWVCETKSNDEKHKDHEVKKYLKEKHHVVKRHYMPIAGGAPFITCYRCLNLVQLPVDFLLFKRRCHRIRCGACSEVLKFSLQNRSHIVPYAPNAMDPPPSEADDYNDAFNRKNFTSASHANGLPHADDYGLSVCKSYSMEGDPVSLTPVHSLQRNAVDRKMSHGSSYKSKGERKEFVMKQPRNKSKNHVETYESAGPCFNMSKTEKLSSEIEEMPPTTGSPLHQLMGYSSISGVINGSGPSGGGTSSYYPVKSLKSRN